MRHFIAQALELARKTGDYERFREAYYQDCILPGIAMPDRARDGAGCAGALFPGQRRPAKNNNLWSELRARRGHHRQYGRGLAGALNGASALPGGVG